MQTPLAKREKQENCVVVGVVALSARVCARSTFGYFFIFFFTQIVFKSRALFEFRTLATCHRPTRNHFSVMGGGGKCVLSLIDFLFFHLRVV